MWLALSPWQKFFYQESIVVDLLESWTLKNLHKMEVPPNGRRNFFRPQVTVGQLRRDRSRAKSIWILFYHGDLSQIESISGCLTLRQLIDLFLYGQKILFYLSLGETTGA